MQMSLQLRNSVLNVLFGSCLLVAVAATEACRPPNDARQPNDGEAGKVAVGHGAADSPLDSPKQPGGPEPTVPELAALVPTAFRLADEDVTILLPKDCQRRALADCIQFKSGDCDLRVSTEPYADLSGKQVPLEEAIEREKKEVYVAKDGTLDVLSQDGSSLVMTYENSLEERVEYKFCFFVSLHGTLYLVRGSHTDRDQMEAMLGWAKSIEVRQ